MSQAELLALAAKILDRLQVPYMVVGSHASSLYGRPRSTHDIDMVIDLPPSQIDDFVSHFDAGRYYLSRQALIEGRMANLIDTHTGDKVDFFLAGDSTRNHTALGRRRSAIVMDVKVDVAAPEDVILSKLQWHKLSGGSDRQLDDVSQILIIQQNKIDRDYLAAQAQTAGVDTVLRQLENRITDEDSQRDASE